MKVTTLILFVTAAFLLASVLLACFYTADCLITGNCDNPNITVHYTSNVHRDDEAGIQRSVSPKFNRRELASGMPGNGPWVVISSTFTANFDLGNGINAADERTLSKVQDMLAEFGVGDKIVFPLQELTPDVGQMDRFHVASILDEVRKNSEQAMGADDFINSDYENGRGFDTTSEMTPENNEEDSRTSEKLPTLQEKHHKEDHFTKEIEEIDDQLNDIHQEPTEMETWKIHDNE